MGAGGRGTRERGGREAGDKDRDAVREGKGEVLRERGEQSEERD